MRFPYQMLYEAKPFGLQQISGIIVYFRSLIIILLQRIYKAVSLCKRKMYAINLIENNYYDYIYIYTV